ncbi:MAG TPA: lysylphosphatidylglycerol synthase domain-containing protein [Stellaceae bacterium]|nr:lysylphosphatidylglycerol synthase domain-containing protein [Stellaceae bacterium]
MLNESIGRRVTGGAGKIGLILCGFGITTALVFSVDVGALWRDLMTVGFGLTIILALHVVVMAIDGMSWRALLPKRNAGSFVLLLWARWVRESTNLLLPVAQIGGEVAGVRLLTLNGVSLRSASASVILDKLAEGMSQLIFATAGLGILIVARGVSDLALAIATGLAIVSVAAIGIIAVQYAGGFAGIERWLYGVCMQIHPRARDAFASVAETIRSTGRTRPIAISVGQHLAAWCLGSGEVWLALRFMGHPISAPTALAIESLGSVITAAGFIVPGAIGVQETGYIAIGAALGLPAELGLAMSLVKRARQILLGLPALASWQAAELGWLRLRRRERTWHHECAPVPSSASNAYVRRAIRVLLRPLANTGLTPNHLTTLRIAAGLAACAACCLGTTAGTLWAGGLWIASCLIDRADGEFARLTRRCSRVGQLYDYAGDVVLNAAIFLAIGIGLRHAVGTSWTIALGAWTALAIASASILAETLERRIGEKSFPSQAGFDFDDILFVLAPVLWSGHGFALLVGGAIGGPVAALILAVRLSQLPAPPPHILAAE